jgi:hypothetical protein
VVEFGRHAILRGWWGNPWGFESPLRHSYDRMLVIAVGYIGIITT